MERVQWRYATMRHCGPSVTTSGMNLTPLSSVEGLALQMVIILSDVYFVKMNTVTK